MIKCKFKVDSIKRRPSGDTENPEVHDVEMSAVYSDDPMSENGQFWAWTPAGSLTFSSLKSRSTTELEPGAEYYIEIRKVTRTTASGHAG